MPIEINSLFEGAYRSVYSSTGLDNVFSNILYTSALLTVIVLVIILFVYPHKHASTRLIFKVLLYIFAANVVVLALHSNFVKESYKNKYLNKNMSNFIDDIHAYGGNNIYADDKIRIQPELQPHVAMVDRTPEAPPKVMESASDILDDIEKRIG
jgi:hypothetical protein